MSTPPLNDDEKLLAWILGGLLVIGLFVAATAPPTGPPAGTDGVPYGDAQEQGQ